jgi:hypothetical protein
MFSFLKSRTVRLLVAIYIALPHSVQAAVYDGGGLGDGLGAAGNIEGPSKLPIRELILKAVNYVLNFLALAAVIAVIVAGIYLIVSNGNDDNKEKAKKIILYVVVGLIIVIMAKVIVNIPLHIFA